MKNQFYLFSLALLMLLTGYNKLMGTNIKSRSGEMVDLTNGWEMRQIGEDEFLLAEVPGTVHTDLLRNGKIDDPFFRTNEADLQWIDKENWEYRNIFDVDPEILNHGHVELVFKGLDTYTEIILNGDPLLKTDNMFREWRVDCESLLREQNNVLQIKFISPVQMDLPKLDTLGYQLPASNDQSQRGGLGDKRISVFARKAPYHYGWDWGPRFVTMGVWRPVYLQAWDDFRLEAVYLKLEQLQPEQAVYRLQLDIQADRDSEASVKVNWQSGDQVWIDQQIDLQAGQGHHELPLVIANPRLWWSNGLGEPFLYDVSVTVSTERGNDREELELGVRRIELVREEDAKGKSFYFKLNGVPVFAKGANYIPNDTFLPRVTDEKYERIIRSAARANMNMLRVWGGGVYENDVFYQLCDRYGILVWQDFMFACSMYPGDDAFLENVRQEAIQNVRRLRNHPSIALWCGNNEIDAAWGQGSNSGWGWKERFKPEQRNEIWTAYDALFHKILPRVIEQEDPVRSYWPSSPLADWGQHASYTTASGDMHYWGVWHGKKRFEDFDQHIPRFMSEFGFQSFPEVQTIKKYTIKTDRDSIGTEVMAAHQRSGIGNERIREYMGWYYKVPKNFDDLIYMSQVLQAEGIKAGLETHRRAKPFCMGTLYWQINDCWPVASWSSIDYYGRWKALHYFAAKAFNNMLVSPVLKNDSLHVYIVSDEQNDQPVTLEMTMMNFDGTILKHSRREVVVPGSVSWRYFAVPIAEYLGDANPLQSVLRTVILKDGKPLSQNILYFDLIKNLDLPQAKIDLNVIPEADRYRIELTAGSLLKNLFLQVEGSGGQFSDNFFDMLPGEKRVIYFTGFEAGLNITANDIILKTVNDIQGGL